MTRRPTKPTDDDDDLPYEDSAQRRDRLLDEAMTNFRRIAEQGKTRLYRVRAAPSGRELLFVALAIDNSPVRMKLTTASQIVGGGQVIAVRELGGEWRGVITVPANPEQTRWKLCTLPLDDGEPARIERDAIELLGEVPDNLVPVGVQAL